MRCAGLIAAPRLEFRDKPRVNSIAVRNLIWIILLLCPAVQASLGGQASSVERDRLAMHGRVLALREHPSYSVHEMQVDGRKIREYALPDGTVFAVAWQGISEPDFSVIFGRYYDEYKEARKNQEENPHKHGRYTRVMRTRNIVVEKYGHMRDVRGRAYVPDLLPPRFLPGEIE